MSKSHGGASPRKQRVNHSKRSFGRGPLIDAAFIARFSIVVLLGSVVPERMFVGFSLINLKVEASFSYFMCSNWSSVEAWASDFTKQHLKTNAAALCPCCDFVATQNLSISLRAWISARPHVSLPPRCEHRRGLLSQLRTNTWGFFDLEVKRQERPRWLLFKVRACLWPCERGHVLVLVSTHACGVVITCSVPGPEDLRGEGGQILIFLKEKLLNIDLL